MKILHLISSSGFYGAESVILNLMRSLSKGPHETCLGVFLNTSNPNTELFKRAAAEGRETHTVICRKQLDRTALKQLRDLVKSTGADVIHTHGYKADVYAYAALREATVPLISTCHTWYDNDIAVKLYGALDRFVLRGYAKVAAVSQEVRQRLLHAGVDAGRIALIHNGIDVQSFSPSPRASDRPLQVGLVGRLAPEKGVDIFLRAAARILAHSPNIRFLVAGDGPERKALHALMDELGIGRSVSLIGRQEDMPAFYNSIDLMVSSSRQEGLPVALLEAMAAGLPVVATAVGDVPSVVLHGETGLLVRPGDIAELACATRTLLEDPLTRALFGSAARERVTREFSVEKMTTAYLTLYEQALDHLHVHSF